MSDPKIRKIKKGNIRFDPGQPTRFEQEDEKSASEVPKEIADWLDTLSQCIKAYTDATKELLNSKYEHIKDQAPRHLVNSESIIATHCSNGIIIRYDAGKGDKDTDQRPKIFVGHANETVEDLSPKISESVLYCHTTPDYNPVVPDNGPEIILTKTSATSGKQDIFFRAKMVFDALIQTPSTPILPPPAKPQPSASITSSFEFNLVGETLPSEHSTEKSKPFIIRNKMRLPVGWDFIEVFFSTDISYWKPEYTRVWAENDLLASVVAAQFRERHFHDLDPKAAARTELGNLLGNYKNLLDSVPQREEILQVFLKDHPVLLCPSAIKIRPKLEFGSRITDFVFREASGEYLLVEIEPSTSTLFVKNGDTSSELNHARNQILSWRRYIEDNLHTVQKELDLPGISAHPRALLVIGRSQTIDEKNRRTLVSLENESPSTRILTYDDVYDNAKALIENLLGPLWLSIGTTEIYYTK
jgi:hypothetical protein